MSRKKKTIISILAAAICLEGALCFALGGEMTRQNPMRERIGYDSLNAVFGSDSGRTFLIDDAKRTVYILNKNGELERTLRSSGNSFYYAGIVREDEAGDIYIADTEYSGSGTRISAERILRFTKGREAPKTVYEITYETDTPMQNGNIKDLRIRDGSLYLAVLCPEGVRVSRVSLKDPGDAHDTIYPYTGYIHDITLFGEDFSPAITTRTGRVALFSGGSWQESGTGGATTYAIGSSGDTIYFADLASCGIIAWVPDTDEFTAVLSAELVIYSADADGRYVYGTDRSGFYKIPIADGHSFGEPEYYDSAPMARLPLRLTLWFCGKAGFLGLAWFLYLLVRLLIKKLRGRTRSVAFYAAIASVFVGALASYMIISEMIGNMQEDNVHHLEYYGDLLSDTVDTEKLSGLRSPEAYGGEDYFSLRGPMDELTDMSYARGFFYYYVLYVSDGKNVLGVVDYEDTFPLNFTLCPIDTPGYAEAFRGETVTVAEEISAYGAYSYVISPIYDSDGSVAAVLEHGINLDSFRAQVQGVIINTIISVTSSLIVLIMLLLEIIFYSSENKIELNGRLVHPIPLRMMMFIVFAADSLQDAFVAVYAGRLYVPFWGISKDLGAAIPLSAQLLASSLSALLCGYVIRRIGAKRALFFGFLLGVAGFAICAFGPTYFFLVAGKSLIGFSMGIIAVSCNSAAAKADRTGKTDAFSSVNAGVLAGVVIGVGIGALLLTIGTVQLVYFFGACMLLCGLGVVASAHKELFGGRFEKAAKKRLKALSLKKFLLDRSIIGFLAFALFPFMAGLSFRGFYFPLLATDNGMQETDIGRIYLVCGLFIVYLGPRATRFTLGRFGTKAATIAATALMCVGILQFALFMSVISAVIGVVCITVATSFGYSAQSSYYADCESAALYGEEKAMGISTLFDNAGQTGGPIIFAALLAFGGRFAALAFGGAIAVLIAAFSVLSHKPNKSRR